MLKVKDISEVVFGTSMSGYKKDEVDIFLDKVLEDYKQFESILTTQQNKIAALEKEISDKDISMNSLNTVLISAQKLADSIVDEAKKQAEETIEAANTESENIKLRTKKALEEIDAVLTEQKKNAQAQVDLMLEEAARKTEGMILAAKDSVTREQLLFDKLKSEVAEFKASIKNTYKEHLESLSKLPEEVVLNPELAASTIEEIINNEPNLLKFIEKASDVTENDDSETDVPAEEAAEEAPAEEKVTEDAIAAEEVAEEATIIMDAITLPTEEATPEAPEKSASGFVIQSIDDDEEEENTNEDDTPAFSKGFFAKHK